MRVACKFAAGGSAGVQQALAAVADELAAGVCADKAAERSKIMVLCEAPSRFFEKKLDSASRAKATKK